MVERKGVEVVVEMQDPEKLLRVFVCLGFFFFFFKIEKTTNIFC